MHLKTLAIVGVGLIGAALGLTARRRKLADHIVGLDPNRQHIDEALGRSAIDAAAESFAGLASAEVIVFCTPVNCLADAVRNADSHAALGTLFTDAGSTKAEVADAIEKIPLARGHFVGAHPLAGSERKGPEHGGAWLFEGRTTIVTQTPHTDRAALERAKAFWEALGTRVEVMTPHVHDRVVALTSHLPHLVAAGLASMLPEEFQAYAASGFRDSTRIASGDPELWTAIFRQNRDNLLAHLKVMETKLADFHNALKDGDWNRLTLLLEEAKKVRDGLGN